MSASRLALRLMVASALLGVACSEASTPGGGTVDPPTVASVSVSAPATSLAIGETVQLQAVARDADGGAMSGRTFTWTSNATARATVSASGLVTGVSAGAVTITGATGGRSGSVQLTILEPAVAHVTILPDTASRDVNGTLQLTAVLTDAAGDTLTGRAVTWTSSDTTVVRVAPDGMASFIAPGSATITAQSEGVSGTATLTTLAPPPVARVALTPDSIALEIDETQQLTVSLYTASDVLLAGRAVSWTTSQAAVATVSDDGLVTAVGAGAAWIVAESEGVRDSAHVRVALAMPETGGAIAAGDLLSCALTAAGEAYCWGRNDLVGDPDAPSRYLEPRKVAGGHTFVAIDVGNDNALALTADGIAYTWGRVPNGLQPIHGQGYDVEQFYEPTPISGGLRFAAISAGDTHSCAITTDGDAYCWGGINFGSLGDGTNNERNAPTLVAGGHKFSRISAGYEHTVALTPEGEAWAWGRNTGGALGDSSNVHSTVPVKVAGGHTFVDVVAGWFSLGLKADGSLWEWGINRASIGMSDVNYPIQIPGHTFSKVSTGTHTLALTPDGELWAWGENEGVFNSRGPGALGDGTMTTSWEPVRVSGGRTYRDMSAGQHNSLAIGDDGLAYGWGDNTIHRTIAGPYDGFLLEPVAAVPARMLLEFSPSRVEVPAGTSADVVVTLERINGGFTVAGPLTPGYVTLAVQSTPADVAATLSPTVLPPGVSTSVLSVTAGEAAPLGYDAVYIKASAANTSDLVIPTGVDVVEPPPPPVEGEEYACPTGSTPLPEGYHCMTAGTSHTAGKFSDVELHGTWVDADAEVCMTWDATGKQGFARYRANGSVTETAKGEWGAMINLDGSRYPNAQYWNIYTETAEPQTQLLTYDSATKTIVNWGFVKGTCPF